MKKRYLLYSILPILFHIVCFPLHYLEGNIFSYGTVGVIQISANIIIFPLYLVIINYRILSSVFPEALKRLVMMASIVLFSNIVYALSVVIYLKGNIDKLGWGIAVCVFIAALLILIIEWGIAVLIKTIRKKIY